ncbi:hypothetical protein H1B27_24020, partial [Bradyrhizobium sp. CNPSo 4019]|nr:hypothetical protein [Bradyrhizobium diversitatis]
MARLTAGCGAASKTTRLSRANITVELKSLSALREFNPPSLRDRGLHVLQKLAAHERRKTVLRRYLLETAASIIVLFIIQGRAWADCAINPGAVTCTPPTDPGTFTVSPPPPPGPTATVAVTNGASVTGSFTLDAFNSIIFNNNGNISGNITAGGITPNGSFTFNQNGILSGNLTTTSTGTNALTVQANRSINTVTMTGAQNTIDNFGVLNQTVTLTATDPASGLNTIINRAGAAINQLNLTATTNVIDNSGVLNQGLQFNNSATATGNPNYDNTIDNRAGGVINGITSSGTASNNVDNSGTINGPTNLAGNYNTFVNRATVNGGVTFGGGNDVFAQVSGTVCCTINLGDGTNQAFTFAGTISSNIQSGSGNDFLYWGGGNIVTGFNLGAGNDTALLSNLTSTNLTPGLPVDGGQGNDQLVFSRSQNGANGTSVSQLWNWESIRLTASSQLTFSNFSTLTLGDSGTGTGTLSIESGSSVLAGNGTHTVRPYDPTALATVNNASLIDLTNAGTSLTDQFVIYGDYVGQNGKLNLQTYLGTDNSQSDQLVIQKNSSAIATPSASGLTSIYVTNVNGPGAPTIADGIRVVDAVNGATTTSGAFTLGAPVGAGVFEYQLFRGGVTANSNNDNDWFLRSTVTSPPPPPPP